MDVDELLSKAWKAVEKAGVPEALQAAAFKEAIDILRGGAPVEEPPSGGPAKPSGTKKATARRSSVASSPVPPGSPVDEDTFFSQLSKESGVSEDDLRDILNLTADGKVQVTPPTKDLGTSVSEQAKTVIALVAGARGKGLNERPVNADHVRREAERKHCLQSNNFAAKHLGPLKGFNAGSNKNEILLTSKWVDEFAAAVNKVHGRTPETDA